MIPNLDIDTLKTFLAIAQTGSFTRAAEEVNKTQSAVSMQMKRLEDILERPLFVRDGRASRLTADGERLIAYAQKLVAANDEAVSAFAEPELAGIVRFGTPDDYAERFLPEILARFARTHPQVQVDVECQPSVVLSERIKHGDIDLAIVTVGMATLKVDIEVRRENLVWVASQRHSVHLQERVPLAVAHSGCAWRSKLEAALTAVGRPYRVAYSSPNGTAARAAILSGLAVGAVPESSLQPGMRVLTERDGFPPLDDFQIGLVHKAGKPSSAAIALSRHVAESLGNAQLTLAAAE